MKIISHKNIKYDYDAFFTATVNNPIIDGVAFDILMTKDKKVLRDYQLTGVKWLYNIYKCGFGGILADEMGLGKSIQLIYFIKEVLKEKKDAKILIIAPTSLIYNWKNEFDKFGSELKYKVCADNKLKREDNYFFST